MRVGVAGGNSTIAMEFAALLEEEHGLMVGSLASMPPDLDRYLICTGYLAGKALQELSIEEAGRTWLINFLAVAQFCDRVLDVNDRARICVMGSESGFSGSYDSAYASAKAALHHYVEHKQLTGKEQMLVGLAPHIIWDSGMTNRRDDLDELARRAEHTRLGRWLTAHEVAAEAHHLLFGASVALSGQIIRLRAS